MFLAYSLEGGRRLCSVIACSGMQSFTLCLQWSRTTLQVPAIEHRISGGCGSHRLPPAATGCHWLTLAVAATGCHWLPLAVAVAAISRQVAHYQHWIANSQTHCCAMHLYLLIGT